MTDSLVVIGSYTTPCEANLVKSQLESAGIPAFVADEYTIGMNWMYSNALGGVKVQVPESLALEAQALLASGSDTRAAHDSDSATCPQCGSRNTGDFTNKTNIILSILICILFWIPLLSQTKKCRDCGHRWR